MSEQQLKIGFLAPALLRRLFSTRVLKQLALGVEPPEIQEIRKSLGEAGVLPAGITLADIFDASFHESVKFQRSEYVYKNAIVQKILLGKYSLRTTSANFEIRIGTSKLDVLLARESLTAYEIKTERDELGRLLAQVEQYRKACRVIWILTCDRHAAAVERLLPKSVGVSVLTRKLQVSTRRPAIPDPEQLDLLTLLGLLRKGEMVTLLEKLGGSRKPVPNTKLFSVLTLAAAQENLESLEKYVASALMQRSTVPVALSSKLPRSVAACALAMDLTTPQSERLIRAFRADLTGGSFCLPITHTFVESSTN